MTTRRSFIDALLALPFAQKLLPSGPTKPPAPPLTVAAGGMDEEHAREFLTALREREWMRYDRFGDPIASRGWAPWPAQ